MHLFTALVTVISIANSVSAADEKDSFPPEYWPKTAAKGCAPSTLAAPRAQWEIDECAIKQWRAWVSDQHRAQVVVQ